MGDILWVTDNGTISTNEQPIYNHLNSKHAITLHDSSSSAPASYETNYEAVIISGDLAAGSTNPGSTYYTSSIPVLVFDDNAAEQMEMGSTGTTGTIGDGGSNPRAIWVINYTETIPDAAGWNTGSNHYEIIMSQDDVTGSFMVKGGVSGETIIGRLESGGSQMLIQYDDTDTDDSSTQFSGERVFFGLAVDGMLYINSNGLGAIDAILVDQFGLEEGAPVSGDYGRIIDLDLRQSIRVRT